VARLVGVFTLMGFNAEASPMKQTPETRHPPRAPFTRETAAQKVCTAEDAWNSRDLTRVSLAHTPDWPWRSRAHERMVALKGAFGDAGKLTVRWGFNAQSGSPRKYGGAFSRSARVGAAADRRPEPMASACAGQYGRSPLTSMRYMQRCWVMSVGS